MPRPVEIAGNPPFFNFAGHEGVNFANRLTKFTLGFGSSHTVCKAAHLAGHVLRAVGRALVVKEALDRVKRRGGGWQNNRE